MEKGEWRRARIPTIRRNGRILTSRHRTTHVTRPKTQDPPELHTRQAGCMASFFDQEIMTKNQNNEIQEQLLDNMDIGIYAQA